VYKQEFIGVITRKFSNSFETQRKAAYIVLAFNI